MTANNSFFLIEQAKSLGGGDVAVAAQQNTDNRFTVDRPFYNGAGTAAFGTARPTNPQWTLAVTPNQINANVNPGDPGLRFPVDINFNVTCS